MRLLIALWILLSLHLVHGQDVADLVQQGNDALTRGETNSATAKANVLIGKFPGRPEGYLLRSAIKDRSGDPAGALADLGIAMELDPDNPEHRFNHGLMAYKLNRFDLARGDFRRLLRMKRNETATVFYRQNGNQGTDRIMTMQSGIDDQLLHYLGLVELKAGRFDRSIELLDSAIALNRGDADLFAHRGLAHEKAGRHDQAAADFDQAFRIDPDHAIALQNRSAVSFSKGEAAEAEESITMAIRSNPRIPDFYAERGQIRFSRKNFNGARSDYDSAILMDQEEPEHYLMRGMIHERMKQEMLAQEDYRSALRLDDRHPRAWLSLGNLFLKQGKLDQSVEHFNEAILLDSLCAACHHNRAIALYRKQQKSAACKDLLRAAALGQQVQPEMKRKICGTN